MDYLTDKSDSGQHSQFLRCFGVHVLKNVNLICATQCAFKLEIQMSRQQELVANIKAPKRHGTRSNNNSNEDLSNRYQRKLILFKLCPMHGMISNIIFYRIVDGQKVSVNEDYQYAVYVSYVEIYNNYTYDLLDTPKMDIVSGRMKLTSKMLREDSYRHTHNFHMFCISFLLSVPLSSKCRSIEEYILGVRTHVLTCRNATSTWRWLQGAISQLVGNVSRGRSAPQGLTPTTMHYTLSNENWGDKSF